MPRQPTGRPPGRPVGWRKGIGSPPPVDPGPKSNVTNWPEREGFRTWGDRLDFLSPENQAHATGRLALLPAKHPEKRVRESE